MKNSLTNGEVMKAGGGEGRGKNNKIKEEIANIY